MAIVTGTSNTYSVGSAGGNREDLADVIWDLFPEDSFALTTFDHETADATFHEWLTDTLAAPAANRQLEGADPPYATYTPTLRLGNYCQISRKTFIISGTQERVKKAGRKSDIGRQATKQMRELKNDMEYALVRNQPGTVGGAATARSSAGMESFITHTAGSARPFAVLFPVLPCPPPAGGNSPNYRQPTGTVVRLQILPRGNSSSRRSWRCSGRGKTRLHSNCARSTHLLPAFGNPAAVH